MTVYLLNALPNSILIPAPAEKRVLEGIDAETARNVLSGGFVSAIGHLSTAEVLSTKLGIPILMNRVSVAPVTGDILVVAAFTPPRRLAEGELFSEQEILSMPINFCLIQF